MSFRWLRLLPIFICLFAAGCGSGDREHPLMYKISEATYEARDENVPEGMKPIGLNSWPHMTLLAEGVSKDTGRDYICLVRNTKLARYEDGRWSKADLRDFRQGMFVKIPSDTAIFMTLPGQCRPFSIILSSKPIPNSAVPERDITRPVLETAVGVASGVPGTEAMVQEIVDPSSFMKPDQRFCAYSCDGQVARVEELRYHQSEDQTKMEPKPYSENQLIGIRYTIAAGSHEKPCVHHIFLSDDTKMAKLENGKLTSAHSEQLKKGMFIRYTTYSPQQDPTWLVFSDSKIPDSVHDPRIAE